MSSLREQALAALYANLRANLLGTVRRSDGTSTTLPADGSALITQDDGTLESERMLGMPAWTITHSVPIMIEAKERPPIDGALLGIAGVVAADQTLGGLVDWVDMEGPTAEPDAPVGAQNQPLPRQQTAQVTVTLYYTANSAAG